MRTQASAIHMFVELSNTEFTPARKSITSVATDSLTRSRQVIMSYISTIRVI